MLGRRLPLFVLTALLATIGGRQGVVPIWRDATISTAAGPAVTLAGSIGARFFPNGSNSDVFLPDHNNAVAFTQRFSALSFDPPSTAACSNNPGVSNQTRPFTDVVLHTDGSCTVEVAQGNGFQAGVGALFQFFAEFEGALTVQAAGQVDFTLYTDDGFILGLGSGGGAQPTRVSGENENPPSATPFLGFAVMGAHNRTGGSDVPRNVVVNFPAAGTYPFELDYTEAFGGGLDETVLVGGQPITIGPGGPPPPPPPSAGFGGSYLYGNGNPAVTAPCACESGDPVNTATGNLTESATDLSVGGRGPGLLLSRDYNSLDAVTGAAGLFGAGWSSSYGQFTSTDQSGNVTVHMSDGATVTFTPRDGGFTAAAFVTATLANGANGTLQFTLKDQRNATFGGQGVTTGKLIALADRTGEQTTLQYDAGGHLTSVTDAAGRRLLVTTDSSGRVTGAADPLGRHVQYAYDAAGNLMTFVDVAGAGTRYSYDSRHRLTGWTDPLGHSASNSYDASDRVVAQIDPLGRTTTIAYAVDPNAGTTTATITDGNGHRTVQVYTNNLLTSLTAGAGTAQAATWTYSYDAALNRNGVTDPNGHAGTATFDGLGNILTGTDALGRTSRFTYTARNDVATATDPLGVTTTYGFDGHGLLASVSRPLSGTAQTYVVTYQHGNPAHPGDLTATTDPTGATTSFSYDAYGNLTSSSDAVGETGHTTYNAIGWPLTVTDPRGNTSSTQYDSFGDSTRVTDPLGNATSYQYDADRNRIGSIDADGHLTRTVFDADNEPAQLIRADGTTLGMGYDPAGNLVSQVDGAGKATLYAYDALNRLISTTDPLGRTEHYGHDPAGNRTSLTDAAGQVATYGYDAGNELTSITYSDGVTPAVRFSYDADAQRISMQDGTGSSSYAFDSLHRLTGQTDGLGQHTAYQYDLRGDLLGLTYPSGKQVTHAFDAVGRLTAVTDWLGHTSRFSYDVDSDLTSEQYPNGITAALGYDAADRLTGIADRNAVGASLLQFGYARDPLGQVTAISGSEVKSYSYTVLNQLAAESGQADGYDGAGNLTRRTGDGLSYDAANELLSLTRTGLSATFSYDAKGNRLSRTPSTGAASGYSYDQANRLTRFSGPGGTATYSYTGDGLRQQKIVNGAVLPMAWNLAQGLPLLLSDGQNQYIYGPGGRVLEQVDGLGHAYFLHQDQLGSVRLLSDATGAVVARYGYDAYGRSVPFGRTPSAFDGPSTPFGFAGEYTDKESGLIFLRARYYDPETGQFLTRDPDDAATRAAYAYVHGNPINARDPSGLDEADFVASLDFSTPDSYWVDNKEYDASLGHVPVGVVHVVDGNASVLRASSSRWEPAYPGMLIYPGDHLKTDEDSVAAINTVNGSTLGVNKREEYAFSETGEATAIGSQAHQTLVLKSGAIWCKFQKQDVPFNIKTLNSLDSVKG